MTLAKISAAPTGLHLAMRSALALLVLILAERAADFSQGEPTAAPPAADYDDDAGEYGEVKLENADDENAANSQPRYTAAGEQVVATHQRLREGTRMENEVGRFKISGDRATFTITATGQRFGGLENLNLARIVNTIREGGEADWSVSGLITEFRGSNYLLVTKAIRKVKEDGLKPRANPVAKPAEGAATDAEVAF